jgi:4-aminobutyrate aminotransferase-like enzyme
MHERPADEILAVRERHLGPSLGLSYHEPLKIVRGHMQFLYDDVGHAYLDGVNNVCHVGHCHPRVVAAGQRQMAVLNTNTRYLHGTLATYVERLLETLPEPLRVCYLVCSGSEANELALRLARTHTARSGVVTVDGAYHGNTQGLIDVSPYKSDGSGGTGLPAHVCKVPMPDPYRGPHRGMSAASGRRYAAYLDEAIAQLGDRGYGLAAFICESLLGCGGQIVLPPGFLREAWRRVRGAGGVCIADEVQVGFGRVGTHFWGFETQDVVPDIVTLGKPIGNGHPLAAVVTTREIAESFDNGMEYFNTFGGNPVSCAIGLAVLDVIRDERLQRHASEVGERLAGGLRELMRRHPLIGDVRGVGLFLGVELVLDRETLEPAPRQATYVVERLKDHGILLSTDGPLHNVLKIKPPLAFDGADADRLTETLDKVFAETPLSVT